MIVIFAISCASSGETVSNKAEPEEQEAKTFYTSTLPSKEISEKLSAIQKSIKRITATAVYETFYFENEPVTFAQADSQNLSMLSSRTTTITESTAGTAISVSISEDSRHAALLTCAHVVTFPDTLIKYIDAENVPRRTYVESISVKRNQNNLLYDLPGLAPFKILATNRWDDLALLEINAEEFDELKIPPLPIAFGESESLQLGSLIFIMGYPKGFPMVTRGIVSDPNRTENGDFLTDALFNEGISGGIMLASRDNYASFEWVGIANTASARTDIKLVPDPQEVYHYQSLDRYDGLVFVKKEPQILYGITQAIPTAKIRQFLEQHRSELRRKGYPVIY